MEWEYILEVPFESKGLFFEKKNAKYKFKGKNYFLLNSKGLVLRDFTILDGSFSYRENDNKMMIGDSGKGTDFWNNVMGNKKISYFRKKILTSSPINFNIKNSTPEMTSQINEMSLKHSNSSLSINGFICGSNSTGSDSKISAAPLICVDPKYYGMRHINPFKNLRLSRSVKNASKKYLVTEEILDQTLKLSLDDYFDLFPLNKKEFYKFNPESKYLFYDEKEDVTETLYYINYSSDQMKGELNSYKEMMGTLLSKYNDKIISKDNLSNKLRGLLRPSLLLEKRIINEPVIIGIEEKESNLDAAHLVEVNDLKKSSVVDWWMMGDVNNGLLLPKDIHWKFDKDKDFFLNEKFEFIKNGANTNLRINPKYINDKRKEYLKNRYKS